MHCPKVALVGLGLLGGSIGLALKERRLAGFVSGYVRRAASVAECEALGIADHVTTNVNEAVDGADVVILCTPLCQMAPLAATFLPSLKSGALLTDVGSVKSSVVESLEPMAASVGAAFVGSHPMAGTEKTGPKGARPDLFENAVCVVTATPRTDPDSLSRTQALWASLGMKPMVLTPERHDDLVSRSSHLPHVVAAELANYVLSPALPPEQASLCATGFKDCTRIASGSPEMWRDIAIENRVNLIKVLGVFIEDLQEFQIALQRGDEKSVEEFFRSAKRRRDDWISGG